MRLDLADLRLFVAIVEAGSITAGAARAHLALAPASARLRNIEADAGVPLLERRHRGVMPTAAGEALAHHARLILRQRDMMQNELRDFAAGLRGTLRIHANTAAITGLLPGRLAPWLAARPRLSVEIHERTSAEIVDALAGGVAEVGIASDTADPGALLWRPLDTDRLAVIVGPGHRFARRPAVSFAAVLDEAVVGLAPGNALQDYLDGQARRAGGAFAFRVRMKTFEGVAEMVAHGVGAAIVPVRIARRLRRRFAFLTVALAEPWAVRRIGVFVRDRSSLSPPARDLLKHLGCPLTGPFDAAVPARLRRPHVAGR